MEDIRAYAIFSITLMALLGLVSSDFEYMIHTPEPIALPAGFETLLSCEMNIEPDMFQWKFYPTTEPYNPNNPTNLGNATFQIISEDKFEVVKKRSSLHLQIDVATAGDYQCLAYYGASVVSSVPWKVTVATLREFPVQVNYEETVAVGNTVVWSCSIPESNPEPYIDYFKNGEIVTSSFRKNLVKSLILQDVKVEDSGLYSCCASNIVRSVNSSAYFNLKVAKYSAEIAPRFIVEPRKIYRAVKDDSVFLECSAVGNPVPTPNWSKRNGQFPSHRIELSSAGLRIVNVSQSDDGVYICEFFNRKGRVMRHVTLVYNEAPSVDCAVNTTDIKQGENLDLECRVRGIPEPRIYWFLNGYTVINDSSIEAVGNKIYIRPIEKRHAGNLQIFASNTVKMVYSSISIKVIPLVSTDVAITPTHFHRQRHRGKMGSTRKPAKQQKMVPPSKPTISRLNDESVVVRWNVPQNNGLPIMFFKVQYRELGPAGQYETHNRSKGSRWKTTNADISPNIKVYDVNNLKPDHIYKFRIAAVYSNNDNKLSPNSDKFHLQRLDFDDRNPLPTPLITRTETVNTTAVKIHWKFTKLDNISVDGFYVSYMSASTAGDYMKDTVDGENTREYIISHLQPDTIYDIKLQSFNSKHASEFSPIMKARTEAVRHTPSTTIMTPTSPAPSNRDGYSLYVIVAGAVIGCALLVCSIALLFVCRKWQKKKTDNRDKPVVDDHIHEGNEYVVGPKAIQRANGCTSNRITITANPLADADNKNQNNMIEMSCLTTQNNNCSLEAPSTTASSNEPPAPDPKKNKFNKTSNRNNLCAENVPPGENYV